MSGALEREDLQPSAEWLISGARDARDRGDLEGALAAWQQMQAHYPGDPRAYAEAAVLLGALNRTGEAELLLAAAAERFPHSERVAVERGWLVHGTDWHEARRRWDAVRTRFPEAFAGYFGGAATLRHFAEFDAADALYRSALARWPDAANLLAGLAASAAERGDTEEALRRYLALGERHPDDPEACLGAARALAASGRGGEAETLLAEALTRFPEHAETLLHYARLARDRGDAAQALARFQAVAKIFPQRADGHLGAAYALYDLGRFGEAELALRPALELAPERADAAWLDARLPHSRGNIPLALERWVAFRSRFPDQPSGYSTGMWSLIELGRLAEAGALMEQAVALFPADTDVAMDWARIPHHQQNWHEAERRWAIIHQRFPGDPAIQAGYAEILTRAGKWGLAEGLLESAIVDAGGNPDTLAAYAECATQRRDWEVAERRWRQAVARFPDDASLWAKLGEMLRDAGRFDDADALLSQAAVRFPAALPIERQQALTATARRRWPAALALWETLKRRHRQNPQIQSDIIQVLWQARQDLEVAAAEGNPPPFVIPPVLEQLPEDTKTLRPLFMRFETLGGTCEFGMVQRRFGAEPISLLRWASTEPADMLQALRTRFAGVGEAEHTQVEISNEEYATRDDRYFMFTHTFIRTTAAPMAEFAVQHLRRMQYMRRKLIHDLSTSQKIFVCTGDFGAGDRDAMATHQALRDYGSSAALLCVRLEDADHPRGSVERLDRGFYLATLDRFSTRDINYEVWVEICRKTDALWTAESHF